ncbi:hypothetical protein [Streptomyces griseus]|uniref:hypothetical protein n=1 Tax=Streptomyces griseus TaxID=1911 RepID=UPI0037BDEAC8
MSTSLPTPDDADKDRAVDLMLSVLEKAGNGIHTITINLSGETAGEHITERFNFAQNAFSFVPDTEMGVPFGELLAIASAGATGGMILRTWSTKDTVRAWAIDEGDFVPLTAAETFNAYCHNKETGELTGPPEGTEYADAPAL